MTHATADTNSLLASYLELHPEIHARFLNTVSLLEYIGARKILKSQTASSINLDLLTHASEELRHAWMFKKMALALDPALISYQEHHLWRGDAATSYFQSLDRAVASLVTDTRLNYLLTTLLIEERAQGLYSLLPAILDAPHMRTILREEDRHLEIVTQELKNNHHLAQLRIKETQLFQSLVACWVQRNGDIIGLI